MTLLRGSPVDLSGAHVEEENTIVHVILRPATLSKIRFTKFYASPLVKFLLDAVSHGCLLVLYTVCVLADFRLPLMDIEIVLLGDRMMDLTREVIGDFQNIKKVFISARRRRRVRSAAGAKRLRGLPPAKCG